MPREGQDEQGNFAPGNSWWAHRTTVGRKLLFQTPDILWEACKEYFEFVDTHDRWFKTDVRTLTARSSKGQTYSEVRQTPIKLQNAYSLDDLFIFLDITDSTWYDYAARDAFSGICKRVKSIIDSQQLQAAYVGLFDSGLVARKLGLAEKREVTQRTEVKFDEGDGVE